METRKVQLSGGSTYIVSLPKRWAEKRGIKNGSTVNLMVDQMGNLTISPQPIKMKESVTGRIRINGKESGDAVMRRLVGAYVSGVTGIEVYSDHKLSPHVCRTVREFTRLVMGVEIVEERSDQIRLQDLIDPADFSIKEGLKRMAYITEKMVEDSMEGFKQGDMELMDDVILRDMEADRICWLIHKEYNMISQNPKVGGKNILSSDIALNFLLASRVLERVADHSVGIAHVIKEGGETEDEKLVEKVYSEGKNAKEIFSDSIHSLFFQDLEEADNVIDRAKALNTRTETLLRRIYSLPSDEAVKLAFIVNSVERIAAYGADIGKTTLNRSYSTD